MAATVHLGNVGIRIEIHLCLSTNDVSCNAREELMPAHFHTLVKVLSPEVLSKYFMYSFYQSRYRDAIGDIRIKKYIHKGDVIEQICIHGMEVEKLSERVSKLCI